MDESGVEPGERKAGGRSTHGHFFAVDSRCWARVLYLGMNAAITYLVMARFSGQDQLTTRAGANAVETYTGISRLRAKVAIEKLEEAGFFGPGPGASRRLTPAAELPKSPEIVYLRRILESCEKREKISSYDVEKLEEARRWGLVVRKEDTYAAAPPIGVEPDWIWLPNSLLDGAGREIPPVELIRQTGDVKRLQLFVDLYRAHRLASDGGIHWRHIRRLFKRVKIGLWRNYAIWGFAPAGQTTIFFSAPFCAAQLRGVGHQKDGKGRAIFDESFDECWARMDALEEFGFFEFVPHLVEADTDEAEVIQPYGIATGEPPEKELALAAHKVGRKMVTDEAFGAACRELGTDQVHLAIAPDHMPDVQMVGIVRLRYRPHTAGTAGWWAGMQERKEVMLAEFKRLEAILSKERATSR